MTIRRTMAALVTVAAVAFGTVAGPPAAIAGVEAPHYFSALLNGAQETPPVATPGTGFGTVVLSADESTIYTMVTFTGLTTTASDAHIHQAPPGTPGGVVFPLTFPAATATTAPMTQSFAITPAQVTQLRAGNYYFNIHSGNFGGGEIRGQILPTAEPLTQVGVFRPSTGLWFTAGGPTTAWGTAGDIAVPGDYDGNGQPDAAVFRPSSGLWFVQGGPVVQFGTDGDIPVPGDYDGNGTTDIAVFRPSTGFWFVQGGPVVQFGTDGDIPVPADWDGDGSTDIAVFRPSNGFWFVEGGTVTQWGTTGDIPVPGNYNGTGTANIAVFRPSTGLWFVLGGATTQWGTTGDVPVPGDYDGDGITSIAVFRPASGLWFVPGATGFTTVWGTAGDDALPLPYAISQAFF